MRGWLILLLLLSPFFHKFSNFIPPGSSLCPGQPRYVCLPVLLQELWSLLPTRRLPSRPFFHPRGLQSCGCGYFDDNVLALVCATQDLSIRSLLLPPLILQMASNIKLVIRPMYSNPPAHVGHSSTFFLYIITVIPAFGYLAFLPSYVFREPALLNLFLTTLLSSPNGRDWWLRFHWMQRPLNRGGFHISSFIDAFRKGELLEMANRIKDMRVVLKKELDANSCPGESLDVLVTKWQLLTCFSPFRKLGPYYQPNWHVLFHRPFRCSG